LLREPSLGWPRVFGVPSSISLAPDSLGASFLGIQEKESVSVAPDLPLHSRMLPSLPPIELPNLLGLPPDRAWPRSTQSEPLRPPYLLESVQHWMPCPLQLFFGLRVPHFLLAGRSPRPIGPFVARLAHR